MTVRVLDSSGLGRDATSRGTVDPTFQAGASGFGNRVVFDGVDRNNNTTVLEAPSSGVRFTGTNAWTVEAKVTLPASVPHACIVAGVWTEADTNAADSLQYQNWTLYYDAAVSKWVITWQDSTGLVALSTTSTFAVNASYDVAAQFDGTTIRIFVDGVAEGSATPASGGLTTVSTPPPLSIGAEATSLTTTGWSSSDWPYTAAMAIDELRISDTARHASGGYTPATAPFGTDANTKALYHLDGAINAVTQDAAFYVYENVGVALVASQDGTHYVFENAGVDLTESKDAVHYVYEGDVNTATPTPHIWWLRPNSGRASDGFTVVGHGFGAAAATYSGVVEADYGSPTGKVPLSVVAWTLVAADADAYTSARTMNPDTDTIDPEHGELAVTIPSDAVPPGYMIDVTTNGA
jgi:hypothetical protein